MAWSVFQAKMLYARKLLHLLYRQNLSVILDIFTINSPSQRLLTWSRIKHTTMSSRATTSSSSQTACTFRGYFLSCIICHDWLSFQFLGKWGFSWCLLCWSGHLLDILSGFNRLSIWSVHSSHFGALKFEWTWITYWFNRSWVNWRFLSLLHKPIIAWWWLWYSTPLGYSWCWQFFNRVKQTIVLIAFVAENSSRVFHFRN